MRLTDYNRNSLYQTTAIFIALLFFVLGRFGFFDILGLKRLLEIILFVPLVLLGSMLILTSPQKWLSPFLLLPCVSCIMQTYWNPDGLIVADLGTTILIIGIILALGSQFSDLLLRYVIIIATFFASLGIIEFFILLASPSLSNHILLFYDYYSGSTVPVIQNYLQLFGLSDGTSYHLFGMSVTRLRSFASEPSLLVGYFLVPGALGLTYQGRYVVFGLICIFFSMCSLAGSVYAALGFSTLGIVLMLLKSRRLIIVLPFILLALFVWVLFSHYNELIFMTKSTGGDYDFLDKTNSANMRFSYIRDFIPKVIASPFGLAEEINQPLGLLIGSMARGGVLGLILIIIILMKLYTALGYLFTYGQLQLLQKIGLIIIYGSLITGILYLDNCFIQSFSFILLLTYNRLTKLLISMMAIRGKLETK